MIEFNIGLDLGQLQDYSALAIVEKLEQTARDDPACKERVYHVRHIERFRLGTLYRDIVAQVGEEMLLLPGRSQLVVDATGVGQGVIDLLEQAHLAPIAVTITAGDAVAGGGRSWRVPKRDLVSVLQVLLQSGRLKIAAELPEADMLVREFLSFRVKISPRTAHDSYGAWREGEHDDLVLAVALACWHGEKATVPKARAMIL